jgi:riboflavin synthase
VTSVFTGIVEEVATVTAVDGSADSAVLSVLASAVGAEVRHGASIAVDGVCLTITAWTETDDGTVLRFDVMGETLKRSSLGGRGPGDRVNLERAARVDSRLDGHVVQGHVDGTGTVLSRVPGDGWETVRFALPPDLARFVAEKGAIAVDGVSLTVTAVGADWFEVGLIPETLRATTLGSKQPGEPVNLEVDVLAKYVARLLEAGRYE